MENLPQSWADLYKLLANPLSVAMLISWIYAQVPLFQSETFPGLAKIAIVVITGLLWSAAITLLSPAGLPTTLAAWGPVVVQGLGVAFGSVAFHQLIKKYFPAVAQWLLALKTEASITTRQTANIEGESASSSATLEKIQPLMFTEPPPPNG